MSEKSSRDQESRRASQASSTASAASIRKDLNTEPIELPIADQPFLFKHLDKARCLGIDIGGSLVKIAYSSSYECKTSLFKEDETIYEVDEKLSRVPTLNFIKFETKYIEAALDYMEKNLTASKEFNQGKCIKATGGGAHKYKEFIRQKLGISVEKEDEMECLINGCNFLLRHIPNEVFTIDFDTNELEFKSSSQHESDIFPYLLVNIGSGVSILKVESEKSYQRVGGSTIGGATLWGLGSLLTDAVGFDEIMELAERGDNKEVDMLIKDIYGGNYEALGLDNELIASSMGKVTRSELDGLGGSREEYLKKFKQEDLVKSILLMICYDVTHLASLYARLYNIKRVYFGGYFIRTVRLTMRFLKYGISFWSQNQLECLFLRHEGYLGAIGAFLKVSQELDFNKYSWFENYAHSSAMARTRKESNPFDWFELNQESHKLIVCPLLDHSNYVPDLIDLTKDEEARDYWLKCFERTIETYKKQCIKCNGDDDEESQNRAEEFKQSYLSKLEVLKKSPFSYGTLTVRSLLDLREHLMTEFGFFDVYSIEKREENKLGLELLTERCNFIDSIQDADKRWHEVFRGVLAGNVYDYGAQAFIEKQKSGELNLFDKALGSIDDKLVEQPGYSDLVEKLKSGAYKCVCLFVDNSGFDIILGILPFIIELLKSSSETKVILCANSKAAINDITYAELLLVLKKACQLNSVINEAYCNDERLVLMENGSASPCIDLSRISSSLAKLLDASEVDLIVLEGMGRAIHTNFDAKFKCDCLKAAVIKNEWLANRFGYPKESKFPIVFKYEQRA